MVLPALLPLCLVLQTPVQAEVPSAPQVRVEKGTPLLLRSDARVRMKPGQVVHARLVFDVYAGTLLVLPKGTAFEGEVTGLTPDRAHRTQARLRGDLTPFATPVLAFKRATLPDGRSVALPLEAAHDGAPLLNLAPPPPRKGGLIRQQYEQAWAMAKDRIAVVTGPDKRDRLVDLLYTQLPYHPQVIARETTWSTETTDAIELSAESETQSRTTAEAVQQSSRTSGEPGRSPAEWTLEANLEQTLSSRDVHVGQAITAVVATPVFHEDGSVAVPQGSVLDGSVTRAKRARWFGRGGDLRFDFHQIQLPDETRRRSVQTTIVGVTSTGASNLAIDSEGGTRTKPQDKLVVPAILFALASRPLDRDHGDSGFGKSAVASNSLGVAGFIVGTAGGWRNVAAGIGYYGTALSVWNRWVKRGSEVSFAKQTRLVLRTSMRRSEPMGTEHRDGSAK